jgi:hypothetical protein
MRDRFTPEFQVPAAEISVAGPSQLEIERFIFQLGPQQRRLYLRLTLGPACTHELRTSAGLGNIAQVAAVLNIKLQRAGDSRRVSCVNCITRDSLGVVIRYAEWRLARAGVEHPAGADAAAAPSPADAERSWPADIRHFRQ